MSRKYGGMELELKLNLSPPGRRMDSPHPSSTSSSLSTSPPSSCLSSEMEVEDHSPEATTSMVLVGCPRCLMYVMLSEKEPKCPRCNTTVLLDFLLNDPNNINSNSIKKRIS